jgi:NhaP-type Na+/H+ or K+/H+ antiporter
MKRYDIGVVDEIYLTVVATVMLSIIAHGVTAAPVARWYGRYAAQSGASDPGCEELKAVSRMPTRM